MKDLKETGSKACLVGQKIVNSQISWTYGKNERQHIAEES